MERFLRAEGKALRDESESEKVLAPDIFEGPE